jgi:hypothetical protein
MKPIKIIVLASIVIASIVALSEAGWIIYHKPVFQGKVIDAETKEPLEGAVAVVTYNKKIMGFGHGGTVILDVRETLTNKDGIFHIPSYTTIMSPLARESRASFVIFKPGYSGFSPSILPKDEEVFFSEDFEKHREVELLSGSVRNRNGPRLYKFTVIFGVVELTKLKTRAEMSKRMLGFPTDYGAKELPLLYKAYKDEQSSFNLK